MKPNILLIEDEPGLVATISGLLAAQHYAIEVARDGNSGLQLALGRGLDLIILGVTLPGRNGFDICRRVREQGIDTPLLMLTERAQIGDRVVGLRIGADDYLATPFDAAELLARVDALIRRARKPRCAIKKVCVGDVEVDFERAEAHRNGQTLTLAAKELKLLQYLAENRGRVVSRDELLRNVWEYAGDISSRTVDTHISWLRQKIEANPQTPQYIHTVRGQGYRFNG